MNLLRQRPNLHLQRMYRSTFRVTLIRNRCRRFLFAGRSRLLSWPRAATKVSCGGDQLRHTVVNGGAAACPKAHEEKPIPVQTHGDLLHARRRIDDTAKALHPLGWRLLVELGNNGHFSSVQVHHFNAHNFGSRIAAGHRGCLWGSLAGVSTVIAKVSSTPHDSGVKAQPVLLPSQRPISRGLFLEPSNHSGNGMAACPCVDRQVGTDNPVGIGDTHFLRAKGPEEGSFLH